MPYISENGETRYVTQAEFDAYNKANGLPTRAMIRGETGAYTTTPAGGTITNVTTASGTLTNKEKRALVLEQEKQNDAEFADVDSKLAQASTGKITLSPSEIAALEARKSQLIDNGNILASGQPVTDGSLTTGTVSQQILTPNTTNTAPNQPLPSTTEQVSNSTTASTADPQVAPAETTAVPASQVQTQDNTTLTSDDPGFVYNDQGELVPADSDTAVEIVQEQQFAEGLQEPPNTEFDFDGDPLSTPTDQPEELGEESVFDTPLEEPEGVDEDPAYLNQFEDDFPPPLEEPPGADEDPTLLNANPEEDGPILLNASDDELAEISAGIKAQANQAALQQTIAQQRQTQNNGDWRVKLRLAPQANYLYKSSTPGILQPLQVTDGVVFPYTPHIDTAYKAQYDPYDLIHSNYRGYFYKNSVVDAINLRCVFTAQSTAEADYLLAVIHFFKSVTKMFYGQDAQRGAPPPLVYLTGLGEYQFNEHTCLVSQFNYNLPADVDYIRARTQPFNNTNQNGLRQRQTSIGGGLLGNLLGSAVNRLSNAGLPKGGVYSTPAPPTLGAGSPTYVPTKMEISISLLPVQSRSQVSQQFSLQKFSNGDLLKGGFW